MISCYLCGLEISEDRTADHVPALTFYPPSLRTEFNFDKLLTVPAHQSCNKSHERDEEYFKWALARIASGSVSGDARIRDNIRRVARGESVGLARKTLQEFEERPSGLYLPSHLVLKRVDGQRILRVAWKIVRGLYFNDKLSILPEATFFTVELVEPCVAAERSTNPLWEEVKAQPSRGPYPWVFDYKYIGMAMDDRMLHCWAMLFWDRI